MAYFLIDSVFIIDDNLKLPAISRVVRPLVYCMEVCACHTSNGGCLLALHLAVNGDRMAELEIQRAWKKGLAILPHKANGPG